MSDFGGQTIEVSNVVEGARDSWNIPADTLAWVSVSGVRFRPLSAQEIVELAVKASEVWKLTAPPVAAILAIKADSLVRYDGKIYEVDGGHRPYTDASGALFKVTVMCQKQQKQIA